MAPSNLFFKTILILGALVLAGPAGAVNLHAIYTASCQREVGIILGVSPRQVFLLNTKEEIIAIERFQAIYLATYPLDTVPMTHVKNPGQVPLVEIKTLQGGRLETLVRGWPVDFSRDKIAFLSLRGSELVIDRSSIWQVRYDQQATSVEFTGRVSNTYDFVHPYAFAACPPDAKGAGARVVKVYPQQLLSDPVGIKRELDRLVSGHTEVTRFESDQQFYAVPQVYTNETSLGLWVSSPSRYGASDTRQNNFTPVLENRFSSGPFGFQSQFLTGSAPMLQSIHEENQTQTYYRMKADYFHFSGMIDPGLLLVGSKYRWSSGDLDRRDIRANDSAFVEFGFDYGRWSLELGVGGAVNVGARVDNAFARKSISIPRLGFRYQRPFWSLQVFVGNTSADDVEANIARANFEFQNGRDRKFVFSLIQRELGFAGPSTGETGNQNMDVESESQTAAAYAYFRFKGRYWFGLSASLESVDTRSLTNLATPESDKKFYPKGGAYLSLNF